MMKGKRTEIVLGGVSLPVLFFRAASLGEEGVRSGMLVVHLTARPAFPTPLT